MVKEIALLDFDYTGFPNLALMKISSFYKSKGYNVSWYNPFDRYDYLFVSKIFSWTKDLNFYNNVSRVFRGGTGSEKDYPLPFYIERCFPDYSLYNITDTAYGFLTRGCPRQCPFCIVSSKEGCKSYKVSDLLDFWNGQKYIKLLDPNIFASPDCNELLTQLVKSNSYVDFTQGLDIRLLNQSNMRLLSSIKVKNIHFAWDLPDNDDFFINRFEFFKSYFPKLVSNRLVSVYVLCNYNTTLDYDLFRINTLKKLGYLPYVMIYDKYKCLPIYNKLQRWVNNRKLFFSVSFNNYLHEQTI